MSVRMITSAGARWYRFVIAGAAAFVIAAPCAAQSAASARAGANAGSNATNRDVEQIRAATAAFKSLDAAVAAGYEREVQHCIDNLPHGAMGYHHLNQSLMDDRLELERPEMLVYERLPSGEYRLNGVEYIVPFSAVPETAEAPTIMGQKLKPARTLGIWYLHVWVWTANPSGLFADWNPDVRC